MANIISERILPEFMGEKDVIMRFMDDGNKYYVTKSNSADEIILKLGVHKFEVKENDKKHVLFLYDCVSKMVGSYYMSKGMHGFTAQEIIAQRDVLRFYKTWSNEYKKWMPCVWGNLDRNCVVNECYGIRTVFKNGKYYVDSRNLYKKEYLVPPGKYDYIDTFDKCGLARVRVNSKIDTNNSKNSTCAKWGIIDSEGKEVLPVEYIRIIDFCNKKRKVTILSKYENCISEKGFHMIREYIFDLDKYRNSYKIKICPVEEWYYEDRIRSILSIAKDILSGDEEELFELSVVQMNIIDRKVLLKLWQEDNSISKEEIIKGIVDWNKHWYRTNYILRSKFYKGDEPQLSEFEKRLFFWKFLFEEEEKRPKKLRMNFPDDFCVFSDENLKKLVVWSNSTDYYDWSIVDVTKYSIDVDPETEIMSALSHGEGDKFGF
jgi:hypothetical protein